MTDDARQLLAVPDFPRLPHTHKASSTFQHASAALPLKIASKEVVQAAVALTIRCHAATDEIVFKCDDLVYTQIIQEDTTVEQLLASKCQPDAQYKGARIALCHDDQTEPEVVTPLALQYKSTESSLEASYDPSVITRKEIEWFLSHVAQACHAINNANADSPVSSISLLSQNEVQELSAASASAQALDTTAYLDCSLLHDFFELSVSRYPQNIAISWQDPDEPASNVDITYSKLHILASHLAEVLVKKGVQEGDIVVICLTKSIEMIVSLLAVLYAGASYCNMEPSIPQDRKKVIVEEVRQHSKSQIGITDAEGLVEVAVNPFVELENLLQSLRKREPLPSNDFKPKRPSSASPAYIVYTSGSTGKPKGIKVLHSNIAAFLHNYKDVFDRDSKSRVLQFPSFSFDVMAVSTWEPLAVRLPLDILMSLIS